MKPKEKRSNPRVPYMQKVSIQYKDTFWRAITKDISQSGSFIISNSFPKIGAEILLTLDLPGLEHSKVQAYVRWINIMGFGVQFKPIGAKETHAINELYKVQEIDESDLIDEF